MGYTVANYKESVAQLADTKGSKVDGTLAGDLTRDDAVGVMHGSLTAEKASGKTVIADIVGNNAALRAKAEALGLISPSSTDSDNNSGSSKPLGIESVRVLNLKQLEIKFNATMNQASAENPANYTIKNQGRTEKTLTSTSCKLGDDKMTVTITLDHAVQDCLTNESHATVIVSKNMMAASKKTLDEDLEFTIKVQDDRVPFVTEVKATSEKKIRITFSEPVWQSNNNTNQLDTSNFVVSIEKKKYLINEAILDLNVINLELDTKLIEGNVTVTVNNDFTIGDYAQNCVFKCKNEFYFFKFMFEPEVTVKAAGKNKVVLAFSKPVKGSNIALYHSDKNNEANKAMATTTGDVTEITFTFAQALPSRGVTLYLVNSENDDEKLVDNYGTNVPDQMLTCNVDNTAPIVSNYEVHKNERIRITFDEPLDPEAAKNANCYVVKKLSDNGNTDVAFNVDYSGKIVTLTFPNKLEDNTKYRLSINAWEDIWGNKNEAPYTRDFEIPDIENPRVIDEDCSAIVEDGLICIVFSEPMKYDQMSNKANYYVSIDKGEKYVPLGDNDTVTCLNDRTIQIYFNDLDKLNNSTIEPYIGIIPIEDPSGKKLGGSSMPYIVKIIGQGNGQENVCIEKAQLTTTNAIKLVFNTEMEDIDLGDIVLVDADTKTAISNPNSDSDIIEALESMNTNSDGETEIVLKLGIELATDVTYAGAKVGIMTIDEPSSVSTQGVRLKPNDFKSLEDKVAPEAAKWDQGNIKVIGSYTPSSIDDPVIEGSITLFFSEAIDTTSLALDTFSVYDFDITGITVGKDPTTVVLNIKLISSDTSHNASHNLPIQTTVTQNSAITDSYNNEFIATSPWDVTL